LEENDVLARLLKAATSEMVTSGLLEITPAHILIALSKLSEDQPSGSGSDYGAELRREFESLGIEPRRFRRRMRALLPRRSGNPQATSAHRSQSAKAIFVLAEALARASSEECGATHMLRASFVFLSNVMESTKDGQPDAPGGAADDNIPHEL
jgi:hypothetical protein